MSEGYVVIDRNTRQVWNPRTKQFQSDLTPTTLYKGIRSRRGGLVPSKHCDRAMRDLTFSKEHEGRAIEINILSMVIDDNKVAAQWGNPQTNICLPS